MLSKLHILAILLMLFFCSCKKNHTKNEYLQEILKIEKDFEKMVADSGMALAFKYFAADNAVMLRKNDSIIHGKEAIGNYYSKYSTDSIWLNWDVEYADISDDATLAYTWGNSTFKILRKTGVTETFKGKFHTVWKRQKDGIWKFVWD